MKEVQIQKDFEKLLQEHYGLIFKICRIYGKTAEDQKDLFQEIVIQLWRDIRILKGSSN